MPVWLQVVYVLFLAVLIPVYWRKYGPGNFLWFSDLALFLAGASLFTGHALPASMGALMVLVIETGWNVDFFGRIVTGRRVVGLADYMFDARRPLWLRALSLFHLPLPVLLVWQIHRLGYDPRALWAQTALAWVVLPATYLLTKPEKNVNWVHGPHPTPQGGRASPRYMALLMLLLPVCVYVPTHFLLRYLFDPA
jgi:hypothetical protein